MGMCHGTMSHLSYVRPGHKLDVDCVFVGLECVKHSRPLSGSLLFLITCHTCVQAKNLYGKKGHFSATQMMTSLSVIL